MSEQIPSLTKGTDSEKKTLLITQDRQQDNIDRYFQASPSEIPPQAPSGSTTPFTVTALPNGFARYHTTNTSTGSAQTLNMNILRPHRIIRVEYAQYITSSGAADATGLNANFARYNLIATKNDGTGIVSLANTNGSQAVSSVVFSFEGYEDIGAGQSVGQTYQHRWTGQNNDTITIEVIVQYM